MIFMDNYLPTLGDNPKYLYACLIIVAPRMVFITCSVSSLELKNKEVFPALIFWPEAFSYSPSKCITFWHSPELSLQNKTLSSTKNKWVSFGPPRLITTPDICLQCTTLFKSVVKPSTHNRKKYGERGSPWRIPQDGMIYPTDSWLIKIEYVTEKIQSIIKEIHLESKPNLTITDSR